jgi:16S rRNA (adenine(1408)-N(1))-methyltransferase
LIAAHDRVVVDLGTGDGKFVVAAARAEPSALVVGIDADASSMVESSSRAARRQALPNAVFVVAAAESLPAELCAAADLVTVHFPWGSLLRGVVEGEPDIADQIASIAAPGARVELLLSARQSDRVSWLPRIDEEAVSRACETFAAHGFRRVTARLATADEVAASRSTWAKRLGAGRPEREVWLVSLRRTPSR